MFVPIPAARRLGTSVNAKSPNIVTERVKLLTCLGPSRPKVDVHHILEAGVQSAALLPKLSSEERTRTACPDTQLTAKPRTL